MCIRRYNAHTVCQHEDPNGTPIRIIECDQQGSCSVEIQPFFSENPGAQALCNTCFEAYKELRESVGLVGDWDHDESCRLFRALEWTRETFQYARAAGTVDKMAQDEMQTWSGPDHVKYRKLRYWAKLFNEFKEWLLYEMRRTETKKIDDVVLSYVVRYMLQRLANDGGLDRRITDPEKRRLFKKAFVPFIRDWPQDFGEPNKPDKNWSAFRKKIDEVWPAAMEKVGLETQWYNPGFGANV